MRYVLVMLGSLVGLVIVAYLLLYLLISVGCIYPANYAEQKINEAYDTILHADRVRLPVSVLPLYRMYIQ